VPLSVEHREHALALALNYGELLTKTGRAADAIGVLSANLTDRERHFGGAHPSVAQAKIPLSAALFGVGQVDRAVDVARQAASALWDDGSPQFGHALGHLALMVGPSVFEGLIGTPTAVHEELIWSLETAIPEVDPHSRIAALGGAAEWLEVTGDANGQARLKALAVLTNVARSVGADRERQQALAQMHAIALARDDARLALQTMLGLALAESEAGQEASAEASYHLAAVTAEPLGPDAVSDVYRNFGLFLGEIGRADDADAALRRSVEVAASAEARGHAELSYGIYAQHEGRSAEAALLLTSALAKLPANHPDRAFAQVHLQALRERRPCGCGAPQQIDADLTALVLEQLPAGLVDSVRVVDGHPQVQVLRSPAPSEMDLIRAAVEQAWADIRHRLAL
jgi:Tfp pilus assembly protein PilF